LQEVAQNLLESLSEKVNKILHTVRMNTSQRIFRLKFFEISYRYEKFLLMQFGNDIQVNAWYNVRSKLKK